MRSIFFKKYFFVWIRDLFNLFKRNTRTCTSQNCKYTISLIFISIKKSLIEVFFFLTNPIYPSVLILRNARKSRNKFCAETKADTQEWILEPSPMLQAPISIERGEFLRHKQKYEKVNKFGVLRRTYRKVRCD